MKNLLAATLAVGAMLAGPALAQDKADGTLEARVDTDEDALKNAPEFKYNRNT